MFDKRYQVHRTFFTVKNVDNVWNEYTVMFDKRSQVQRTFFTVKHFPNSVDAAMPNNEDKYDYEA